MSLSASEKANGFVYFVSDGEAIKIGWSKQIVKRMSQLQCSIRTPLTVLATASATRDHERALHHRFRHLKLKGEWFRIDAAIFDYIEFLQEGDRLILMDEHREDHKITQLRRTYRKTMSDAEVEDALAR